MLTYIFIISACGSDTERIPFGTWKHATQPRYITIEPVRPSLNTPSAQRHQYQAVLFSIPEVYTGSHAGSKGRVKRRSIVKREQPLPAFMKGGILMLKANDIEMQVLYHPDNQQILINGVSQFHRVVDETALLGLSDFQQTNQ